MAASPPARRALRPIVLAFMGLAAIAYLGFIAAYCSPDASGSDESGYLNIARLLARGEYSLPVPPLPDLNLQELNPLVRQPLGFQLQPGLQRLVPTYPVGYPLHLHFATAFIRLEFATILVNTVLVGFAGALMIALGRQFALPWSWAIGGAALLWASPLFVFMSIRPMSDMPATVWTMAVISAALAARQRWFWGFVAGVALSVAVLVRPANLLLVLPVGLAFGLRWRAWCAFAAGGLPGALFQAWWNRQLYGTPLTTGYQVVAELFGLGHVPHNLAHFALWVPLLIGPPVAIATLALPWLARTRRTEVVVIGAWLAVFVGFYAPYYHSGESWWYLRFILPAFPAFVFAGMLVLHEALGRRPPALHWRILPAALLVAAIVTQCEVGSRLNVVDVNRDTRGYPETADWLKANLPASALVLQMQTSGALAHYTDFTLLRWDYLSPASSRNLYAAAHAAGRPIYATLVDFEVEEWGAFAKHLSGEWDRVKKIRQVTIWRLRDPATP